MPVTRECAKTPSCCIAYGVMLLVSYRQTARTLSGHCEERVFERRGNLGLKQHRATMRKGREEMPSSWGGSAKDQRAARSPREGNLSRIPPHCKRHGMCNPFRVGLWGHCTQGRPAPLGRGQPWALLFYLFEVEATRFSHPQRSSFLESPEDGDPEGMPYDPIHRLAPRLRRDDGPAVAGHRHWPPV